MYYYVRDCPPTVKPHFDARWSREQKLWCIRSRFPLAGFVELDYYVVREFFKVGY